MIFREYVNGVWLPTNWGMGRVDDDASDLLTPPADMPTHVNTTTSDAQPGWFRVIRRGFPDRIWYHWRDRFSVASLPSTIGLGWYGRSVPGVYPWEIVSRHIATRHTLISLSLDIWNRS